MTNIISKNSKLWVGILLLASILFSTSCSSDKVSWEDNDHRDIWLRIVPMELVFEVPSETKDIYLDVAPFVDVKDIKFELSEDGKEWCSVRREGNNLKVTVLSNDAADAKVRKTSISFTHGDKKVEAKIVQMLKVIYPREGWTVSETSWPYFPDGQTGMPEDMLDGKFYDANISGSEKTDDTYFAIYKPGKGGVPETECYFIVDMAKELEISFFKIRYRTGQPSVNLRVKTGTFYGSTDGITFTPITTSLTFNETEAENEFVLKVDGIDKKDVTYRYIKFSYDTWNPSGNTLQIAEFYVGQIGADEE